MTYDYNTTQNEPLSVFVTNLGKYNEGALVGQWVNLPTTPEHMQQVFKDIGIDGKNYEETFLTDVQTNILGLRDLVREHSNLNELNYLADKIQNLDQWDFQKYEAILCDHVTDMQDAINLTESLDNFDVIPDINNDYDLGNYYVEEAGIYDLSQMGNLANYIDYESFGRDVRLEEGGDFCNCGYVRQDGDIEGEYNGVDIPEEYNVLSSSENSQKAQETSKITVLLVEPKKEAKAIEIDNTLAAKQEIVGGSIQAVYPYAEPVALISNEEGKMIGLPLNRAIYDEQGGMQDIVAGTFIVCGLSETNFASLSPEHMAKFKEQFKQPEQFMKIDGELVALKIPELKPPKEKNDKQQQKQKPKKDMER